MRDHYTTDKVCFLLPWLSPHSLILPHSHPQYHLFHERLHRVSDGRIYPIMDQRRFSFCFPCPSPIPILLPLSFLASHSQTVICAIILPADILSTPLGAALRPTIDAMFGQRSTTPAQQPITTAPPSSILHPPPPPPPSYSPSPIALQARRSRLTRATARPRRAPQVHWATARSTLRRIRRRSGAYWAPIAPSSLCSRPRRVRRAG